MTSEATLIRKVVRYLPTAAAAAGMIVIFGSIVFFFETDYGRIAGVTGGMLLLLGAVWYTANPFLKNRRRYRPLRAEVNKFIKLVTALNRAATTPLAGQECEGVKAAMHESVERMAMLADKRE